MKRGFSCGGLVIRAGAPLACIVALAALLPLACHAYDEAAYEAETSEATDAATDATVARDALADGDTDAQTDAPADAMTDAGADANGADAADASCAAVPGADTCDVITTLKGTQTVDGLNTEFCGVPYLTFDVSKGNVGAGTPPFPSPAPMLTLQVAWTASALAIFAHVQETPVRPETDGGALYNGDAIELFVSASSAALKGTPGGDPGTLHFVLAPPSSSGESAVGQSYDTNSGSQPSTPLEPSTFVGVLVADGYDIEVTFPWALFGSTAPTTDSLIGFDFGLDVSRSDIPADAGPDAGTRVLQGFYYVHPGNLAPPTACSQPAPFCDDRTWCTPQLE